MAIGEIGYDEQTALEDKYFRLQLDLASELELPVMIHTPHRDKKRGTSRSMDVIVEHGLDPSRVVIDHVNEETVQGGQGSRLLGGVLDLSPFQDDGERMVEIVRKYGAERLIVDSACDWGVSDPLSVPKTATLLAERGSPRRQTSASVTYANALAVYGQSGQMREEDWLAPAAIDQRTLYQGNTVLRGGQAPLVKSAKR